MKRLFTAALFALSSIAFGATLTPVQLLNPAGSTSGQTIVSTGPSTAPGWASVPLSGLSSIASNTVLANVTASSAAPSAFAMPSCSTSSSILQYTTSTGFTCNTSVWGAPPNIGFNTPGTGNFTTLNSSSGALNGSIGQTTPFAGSFTTLSASSGLTGLTSTTLPYTAGTVGEYFSGSTSGTSMTTATATNCASISLPAGDWDVQATIQFTPSAGPSTLATAVSTSVSVPALQSEQSLALPFTSGQTQIIASPVQRIPLSATTTVYAVGVAGFSSGTVTCNGYLRARRAH
ncbi:hypothetical protein [Burkholderia multivorans]|uniref:hypothetical protein n=1 Tax=Burkholderia multivorans TaxID=87883 RepID=UPI000B5A6B70|nr:hypothetical protein [Burkholderia multivorans]